MWAPIFVLTMLLGMGPDEGTVDVNVDLEGVLQHVKATSFPELRDMPLRISRFQSETVFFMSNFDVVAALDVDAPLQLIVLVNDAVTAFPEGAGPSPEAITAIVAHELAHSLDYVQRRARHGNAGLWSLLPSLLWPPAEAQMERRTDLVAVQRGYGAGLIAYRSWLYRTLSPKGVAEKRRVYYSPLELDLLRRLAINCPAVLQSALDGKTVPMDARAIVALADDGACFR